MLRKSWNRLNQLFQDPSYRTKFGFFILVGFVLALVQSRISNPEWQNFLQEFSVTFVAIGIIQFLWDFLGGDPMELKINAISDDLIETKEALFSEMKTLNDEVVDELRDFKVSMRVMNDLVNGNLGIERIWPDRGRWQYDQTNGRKYWEDRLSNAKTIDIMSNTLWQSWLNPDEFSERFFSNIRRGARVRIILYDPKPRQDKKDPFTVLDMRAIDEEEITRIIKNREMKCV